MTHTDGLKDVETLINRFGGMRPMARKVDVAVSTIQGWKKRDHIPSERVAEVVAAARSNNISLDGFDVSNENKPAQSAPVTPKVETPTQTHTTTQTPSAVRPPQSNATKQNYSLDARAIKASAVKRSVLTTVSIIAILGGVGYVLFANEAKEIQQVVQNQGQIETRLNSFETTVTDGLNALNAQVKNLTDTTQPLSSRIASLESQIQNVDLSTLTSRFENLTQVVTGQGGNAQAAFSDLQSVVNSLQDRIEGLDASLEQAKATNLELAESMGDVTGRDLSAAAMLLAMTQMRDSMNRSQPFADDLTVLKGLVGNDDPELTEAIDRLAPYAENGILTPEGMSNELRGVTGEIVAGALRGEDVSVSDKIMARLGQILSVQKDGQPVLGIEAQAVVARAQTALDKGDVQTALRELNKLEGEAANAANPVTNQLQGAVNADQTISMMMKNLIQKLQNPDSLKSMIQNIPSQGGLIQDDASGIILLE